MEHIVNGVLTLFAAICGILIIRILLAFRDQEERVKVSFQLLPDRVVSEFTWLFVGSLLMTLGYAASTVGAFTDTYYWIRAGQIGAIVFVAIAAGVLLSWERRFTGNVEGVTGA